MIIKDLWIIASSGLCLYHYHASFSEYEIDETLFSGFIAALSSFAASLAKKQIDFLKMQNDEIYFISLNDIIVVSIMNTAGGEQHVIEQILKFIGEKFLKSTAEVSMNDVFDSEEIKEFFTKEIEEFCGDETIYDDIKREMINDLSNQVVQGKLSPDVLYWKIMQLYSNSTPDEITKMLMTFENLKRVLPTITDDIILLAKIDETFQSVKFQLNITLNREKNYLLVLCEDNKLFEAIANNFMPYGTYSILYNNFSGFRHAIENWNRPFPYNVMVVRPSLTRTDLNFLLGLKLKSQSKIFLFVENLSSDILEALSDWKEGIVNINPYYHFDQFHCQFTCSIAGDIVNQFVNVKIKL
ncbi:MAG: hypothetical protein ACFFDI_09040 [Promethearchaeota archaeon]